METPRQGLATPVRYSLDLLVTVSKVSPWGRLNEPVLTLSEPKSIEELRRLGARRIKPSRKGKDSILHGIQYLQGYHIVVDPRCTKTISELENYEWQPNKQIKDEYLNKPRANGFDHCMDALRYAVSDMIPRNKIRSIGKASLGL